METQNDIYVIIGIIILIIIILIPKHELFAQPQPQETYTTLDISNLSSFLNYLSNQLKELRSGLLKKSIIAYKEQHITDLKLIKKSSLFNNLTMIQQTNIQNITDKMRIPPTYNDDSTLIIGLINSIEKIYIILNSVQQPPKLIQPPTLMQQLQNMLINNTNTQYGWTNK
jgi:hypothetical protein